MPNKRFKMCSPCSQTKKQERSKKYQNEHKENTKKNNKEERKAVSKSVIITCANCNLETEVPSRLFKLCPMCSRQKQLEHCKKYKQNNKEKVTQYNKIWKQQNKENITTYNREYERERKKRDVKFKILRVMRTRISDLVRVKIISPQKKPKTTLQLIDIHIDKFLEWLKMNFKADMSFENYGSYWHIDHVVPCSWFDISNPSEQKICFHWTNMRPLEVRKNLIKSDKCDLRTLLNQEIIAYAFSKNTVFKPLVTKLLEKSNNGSS